MPKYKGDAYLRLSYSADRSVESDSIANQKKLIEDFVAAHPDIELVSERVDDGYSGVLFDRPAFQEMMNDIVSGKINCVIVKDLSRLGREYIETGRYLRQVFPTYGVRFISINDGIDTANEQNGDDLHISLKNLLNDTYCRDISVKTRSALLTKRQNGDYVGACPIYGYRKDPENKNHLIIDEYPARVVQDIYRRRIDGASAKHIAEELNRLGVLSPMAYKNSRGLPHPTGGFADVPDAKWSGLNEQLLQLLPTEQPHLHSSGRWELTFLRRVAHDQLFGDGLLQSPAAQAAAVPYRIGGESFPSGLPVFTTAILPHPVYELLNIICGQLVQRNVTEPWADIQADIIFVACPCVWPDGGFTAGLIPECHPLAEGHIRPDLNGGCRSHGLFQRFQFRHALRLGHGQHIFCFG